MRTTALARPHRRTSSRSASRRSSRTLRSLENRFATFGHNLPRRRGGSRTNRRRIHRTRSCLRNDQSSRRSRRSCARCRLSRMSWPRGRRSRSCRTRFAGLSRSAMTRRGYSMKCWRCGRRGSCDSRSCLQGCGRLGCRNFGHRNRCFYGFSYWRLVVGHGLGGFRRFCGRLSRSYRRLRRDNHS
jgi:hypothetical protein